MRQRDGPKKRTKLIQLLCSVTRADRAVCSPVPTRGVRVPRSVEAAVNACGFTLPPPPSGNTLPPPPSAAFRSDTCAGASGTLPLRLWVGRCPADRHSSAGRAEKLARSKCTHAQPGAAGHIPCAATAGTPAARLPTPLRPPAYHPRCCMRRYEGGQRWSPPDFESPGGSCSLCRVIGSTVGNELYLHVATTWQ